MAENANIRAAAEEMNRGLARGTFGSATARKRKYGLTQAELEEAALLALELRLAERG
jgi:hypothetical protein